MKMTQKRLARPSIGGFLSTRAGSLTLALVCVVCAGGILLLALGSYKTKLQTPTKQATVLVATAEIQKGTSGDTIAAEGLYKSMPIVATQLAPGALSDAAALSGMATQSTILPGQQLTAADFAPQSGVTGQLQPNQRAVSVAIDEAHGDTDVLQAGDHVDVYADFSGGSGNGSGNQVVLLVPDALVLKPASSPSQSGSAKPSSSSSISGASLVLVVSSAKVPQVEYAADNGRLYLALRPADGTASPAGLTTLDSILRDDANANTTNTTNP